MSKVTDFGAREVSVAAVIPTGTAKSGYVDLFGTNVVGFYMPAAWTAAALTFQFSPYDPSDPLFTQWNEMWKSTGANDGAVYEISATAAAQGNYVSVPDDDFLGIRFLIVRSGTVSSAVNQTRAGDTTVTLICRPVM